MKTMFTARELRAIASTGVVAATGDVTPVLGQIYLSYDAETNLVTALSTDRYRIARNRFPLYHGADYLESFEILLDAKLVQKFWTSIKTAALRNNGSTIFEIISGDGETVYSLEFDGQKTGAVELRGNYPPVGRLMPDSVPEWTPAQRISLNMSYVGDLAKIYAASDDTRANLKNIPWQMFTQDGDRPQPVYFTRPTDDGAIVDYLLQPNLIVNR